LLDASAIVELVLREEKIFNSIDLHVIELTKYECLNAVWKLVKRGIVTELEGAVLGRRIYEVLNTIDMITIGLESMMEVLKLALETGLTVYDASYLYVAKDRGLILVSEDEELTKKAIKYGVKALNVAEFLAMIKGSLHG